MPTCAPDQQIPGVKGNWNFKVYQAREAEPSKAAGLGAVDWARWAPERPTRLAVPVWSHWSWPAS